jgi:hypothetical protein
MIGSMRLTALLTFKSIELNRMIKPRCVRAYFFLLFCFGLSTGVIRPAFAGDTVWLACDGESELLSDGKVIPFQGRVLGFNESSQSVISRGLTRSAEFNSIAVVWDEDTGDGVTQHFSVNRSTLKLDGEARQNGKIGAFVSGTCRKTQPPTNNQF